MSFSVFMFAADPEKLREKLAGDPALVHQVAARARRQGVDGDEIQELCARVNEVRSLHWPAGGDMFSVNALMWVLDYAAEPINIARLQDVRYSSDIDEIPLLPEMTAEPGPLPLPDIRGLECEIGYLSPDKMRELAERGAPPCANPHFNVGTELIEVFQSLADDDLGLYTVIDGARITRGRGSRPPAAQGPSIARLRDAVRTIFATITGDDEEDEDSEEAMATMDRELLDAAEAGDVDKVRELLKQGADVSAKRCGYTTFTLALGGGHIDVCRVLLDAGARADAINEYGATAMHVAAGSGSLDSLEFVHRLGLPIDGRDGLGCTALFEADSLEAAAWLLQHGADVNAPSKYGTTPLHQAYATSDDYEEEHGVPSPWMRFLEQHGADPTMKDEQGRTPRDFPIR